MERVINLHSKQAFNYSDTEGKIHTLDSFISLAETEVVGDHNGFVGYIVSAGNIISDGCLSVGTIIENYNILKMIAIEVGPIEIIWYQDQ